MQEWQGTEILCQTSFHRVALLIIRRVVLVAEPVLLTALSVFFPVFTVFVTVGFFPQLHAIEFVY
jgi:hypothetical protein